MSRNSEIKNAVRKTKEWKDFRKHLIEKQKIDPITGKPIRKGANLHHRCLDVNQYDNLDPERFVLLNRNSHSLLHMIYGDERHRKDWRKIIDNLIEQCACMDKYNGGGKMNEEKSLREEIADVKRLVNDIAAKLNDIELEMKKYSIETVIMHDERHDKQPKY